MKQKRVFLAFFMLQLVYINTYGQFFTICADSLQKMEVMDEETLYDSLKADKQVFPDTIKDSKGAEKGKELFSEPHGCEVSIEKNVPVFVNVRTYPLFDLIQKRVTVCLPLDYLKQNSGYGYRTDPVYKCQKFHDGIDLSCRYENVYAMLPGVVKEVHRGNRGYGNYVVLQHGNIECLYGHLSLILVNEHDEIQAGDVVAISGNTGKSTGPHLHLRLKKDGKSVDPKPFITYLNGYIDDLQDRIASLKFGEKPDKELNIGNLAKAMETYHVKYPKIVIAQSLLETGYFTSRVCLECKNLFGLRRPSDGSYYKFERWEDSVKAYRDYVQYKYKGGNYYQFLNRIGYAEDKEYVLKVSQIAKRL